MEKILTAFAVATNSASGCTVNGKPVDCGRFFSIFILAWLALMVSLIVFFVFWLLMLIHAIKNDIPNKTLWIVLMGLFQFPAIIYYFAVKRKFRNTNIQATQPPAPQPPVNPNTLPPRPSSYG